MLPLPSTNPIISSVFSVIGSSIHFITPIQKTWFSSLVPYFRFITKSWQSCILIIPQIYFLFSSSLSLPPDAHHISPGFLKPTSSWLPLPLPVFSSHCHSFDPLEKQIYFSVQNYLMSSFFLLYNKTCTIPKFFKIGSLLKRCPKWAWTENEFHII